MFLKRLSGLMIITSLSFSGMAIAQTKKNSFYLPVGADSHGFPISLDLSSIEGTNYTIVQKQGDGIVTRRFYAACNEGRLFSKKLSIYAPNGKLINEDKTEQELFPKPKTADAAAMEIICRVETNRNNN
ncbi:hypothetical protein [Nostoc sp. MS1]|uniref:hypothetical protein n=1 Tax=Nostoc sp. MS1 TaxID=2764711 RepID=UPI001CC7BDD1|nr:hypothetical protein [Nostoc sp. MS1]BCL36252.1 hypothetical protein NSMS1_26990 [Nostoc sp. MS1]